MFNVETDPGEKFPLAAPPGLLAAARAAVRAMNATLAPPNFAPARMGYTEARLQPCCDPAKPTCECDRLAGPALVI